MPKTEIETTETKTFMRTTIEETIAKLGGYLGTQDDNLIKMFSILTKEGVRKKSMLFGDIDNYKYCKRLMPYAKQDLYLNVSQEGIGRNQIVDVMKVPFQLENQGEKGRLQKIVDLFR